MSYFKSYSDVDQLVRDIRSGKVSQNQKEVTEGLVRRPQRQQRPRKENPLKGLLDYYSKLQEDAEKFLETQAVSAPATQEDPAPRGRNTPRQDVRLSGKIDRERLAAGIREAAEELGIPAVDLATVIGYETAGTFDPTKAGPVTKYGRHRGLIQFGEPQAQTYGVNWEDPYGSQLGREGAIVKYLRAHGFKNGMDFRDLYSTINAGRPGRYNASDSHWVPNSTQPRTVQGKVDAMEPWREKARALLGET
jgi:hypothetical protein